MTKDMILVGRWTNGTKCVGLDNMGGCSHFSWPAPDDAKCNVFGEPLSTGDGILRRCPTCLATPPAVVLTPEMVDAVKNLESWYSRHPKGGLLGHAKAWARIRAAFPPEATNG